MSLRSATLTAISAALSAAVQHHECHVKLPGPLIQTALNPR